MTKWVGWLQQGSWCSVSLDLLVICFQFIFLFQFYYSCFHNYDSSPSVVLVTRVWKYLSLPPSSTSTVSLYLQRKEAGSSPLSGAALFWTWKRWVLICIFKYWFCSPPGCLLPVFLRPGVLLVLLQGSLQQLCPGLVRGGGSHPGYTDSAAM